jgi:hypothetical protein
MEDDADPADAADDDDGAAAAAAAAAADDEDDDGAWVAIACCYGGFIHVVNCLGAAKEPGHRKAASDFFFSGIKKPGGGKTGDRWLTRRSPTNFPMDMFEGEGTVCPSFTAYLRGVQQEASVLKCLAQLRTLPPGADLASRLQEIEMAVASIEQNMEEFNDFLAGEQRICDVLEAEVVRDAEAHKSHIDALEAAMVAACPATVAAAPTAVSKHASSSSSSSASKGGSITLSELETVPKSTRGRSVTVGVANAALSHIKALADDKEKTLAVPRKKMTAKQMQVTCIAVAVCRCLVFV